MWTTLFIVSYIGCFRSPDGITTINYLIIDSKMIWMTAWAIPFFITTFIYQVFGDTVILFFEGNPTSIQICSSKWESRKNLCLEKNLPQITKKTQTDSNKKRRKSKFKRNRSESDRHITTSKWRQKLKIKVFGLNIMEWFVLPLSILSRISPFLWTIGNGHKI